MEENDEITTVTDTVETPDPARTPVEYVRKTRADRLRENAQQPDFAAPKAKTTDMVFKESVMNLTPSEINEIMRNSGIKGSAWEQTGVAIENALTNMNQLPDELAISVGNLSNYITGGQIGQELQDVAFESLKERMADVQLNNESVGGVSNLFAQIAGGSVSFMQLALEGLATGGYLSLAHIGAQSFGEGVYNDMKKYADEHDGSLKGYRPNGTDLAINTANMIMQVAIEERLGVGSPRFLRGWSRGFWKEAGSGFVQEAAQDLLSDFAEVLKGNEDAQIMLENADQYLLDGLIGAILQGPLGAVTYSQGRRRADHIIALAHAQVKGRNTPIKEDFDVATKINDAKERNYMSAFTEEFKAAFDASTGEGQLQANIAKAINDAIKAKELDLGIDDETKRAQKVEQIATQETLTAMEMATEQNKSISEMGINNIVYKDGAIWVEGMTPELGERAVEYARVLAERQTGLAEVQMKLDATNREIAQIKKDLAEAKVQSKEAFAEKLQARLEKQTKLAEKRKIQAEQLKAQTDKIEAQIAKQLKEAPKTVAEPKMEVKSPAENVQKPVETRQENVQKPVEQQKPAEEQKPLAKVAEKLQKPKGEKKSLSAERGKKSKTKAKAKKKMTLKELKAALKEHFKKAYNGVSDDFINRYVDEAIEDVELTRNKNTMLRLLAENFDQYYKDGKVDTEEILYDGDIKGETVFAQYMMETDDLIAADDSDSDAMEVVDTFLNAVHDLPITTKEQAMEWVKNHQYQSTIAKLGLDEEAVDNDVFEFEGSEYDLSQITREDLNEYEQKKVKDHISKEEKKKHLTREDVINNLTENNDRFLKLVIPVEGKSFIEANQETLDKIDIFAKADFLQRALANDKITPAMIDEIFDFVKSMPQDAYLSNVYYDIAVKPTTNVETAVKAKEEYDKIFTPKSEQLIEDWAGKTPSEVGNEGLGKIYTVYTSEIKPYTKDGVITDRSAEENQDDLREVGKTIFSQELLDYMFLKYDFDPRVQAWVKENPDLMHNNDEQKDAWENYSESDLVDILGEDMDFPPENLIQYDENTKHDEEGNAIYDYEQSVYKMPSTQEEFEAKIAEAMIKQTKNALEIEDSDIDAYEVRKNETPYLFQSETEYTDDTIVVDGKERTVYNSEGNRIATTKEALTNFWRWFGDSKVVDDQGRPLVVYHGSETEGIEEFDNTKNTTKQRQIGAEEGYFFTDSKKVAERFRTAEQRKAEAKYYREGTTVEHVEEPVFDKQGREVGTTHYAKTTLPEYKDFGLYPMYLRMENISEYDGEIIGTGEDRQTMLRSAKANGKDGVIIYNADTGAGIANEYIVFDNTNIKSPKNEGTFSPDTGKFMKQSKAEGTGSDKYRGAYDEKLKRIILSDKSDLTTIQHEFAHYWLQNNFKWARSGLASPEWLRKWRDVEEALGIEPQDRFLSKQASEKFARAYERFIMEGKYNDDLKWAFDGFKEFYDETYEDLKNEYFDLSEELDPAIVDWFNRQRPTTEKALKEQAYKKVATVAMAQGAEIVDKVDDNTYTVSSMNKNGEIETEVLVSDNATKDSKLVEYSGKKKERRMVKGLQEINKDINSDMYKAVNNAGTVENARNWVESDYNGAWQALNDPNTALIDRTALYQAFKSYAEDGHPEVAVDLAQINLTKEMTDLGQAMSILSERSEFDPMNIIDMAQKALGEPSAEDLSEETADMHVEQEQSNLTEQQVNDLKNQTECKL